MCFCLQGDKVVCLVTNKEMIGKIPAIVIVPGKLADDSTPNVLSQGAFAQLSKEELEMEYGPVDYKIRLAPTLELLKEIQEQLANDIPNATNNFKSANETRQDHQGASSPK